MEYGMLYFSGKRSLEKNISLGLGVEVPRMNDTISIPVRDEITIGSDPKSYVVIEDGGIDKAHAKVVFRPESGDCYLENMSSKYDILLNGHIIPKAGDPFYLKESPNVQLFGSSMNRDVISLSKKGYSFIFEIKTV